VSEVGVNLKSWVGQKSPLQHYDATDDKLKEFCAAVGAEFRGDAPPTFMAVLLPGMFKLLEKIGIPLSSVLHTDQEYRYHQPIAPGDRLAYETVLSKAFEKQGRTSSRKFMVFETEVHADRPGAAGLHIGSCKTTLITRE
jgi:hypothetical protein